MKSLLSVTAAAALVVAQVLIAAEPFTPAQFVSNASEAGLAGVELGKLAAENGDSAQVRAFAQRMLVSNAKARAELDRIAAAKGLRTTTELSAGHSMALEKLRKKSGSQFDAAFMRQIEGDQDEVVDLYSAGARLPDRELAEFAGRTLPVLQWHQQDADKLAGSR